MFLVSLLNDNNEMSSHKTIIFSRKITDLINYIVQNTLKILSPNSNILAKTWGLQMQIPWPFVVEKGNMIRVTNTDIL